MTQDHHHDDGLRSSQPPGIARRTAVAAAWTTPVVAAAVAAPGASASPAPVGTGTFAGLILSRVYPRSFQTRVIVNGDRTATGQIVLAEDVEVRITVEHDVESWGTGVVPEGPGSGRFLFPAGSYAAIESYPFGTTLLWVSFSSRPPVTRLSASPRGAFSATIAIVRGPVFPGPDPSATEGWGLPSATSTIDV
ncbi:hypothetical protein EDF35_2583 [Rathayibacter sp. PhB151]|uniref:hypothetical protein n=1 Tax=Rathayibacter sp. PhB151 TaxID=2485189 RepID=UPI001062FC30|nr:hypothetical protein [Rathayibacter sp. PhB151]TDX79346.1 hypothetical protein EDF35_2583 [Rathayibacter sp. PhB151]